MSIWAVILAAGSSTRLADATSGEKKQFLRFRGVPLFWHCARTFASVPRLSGLVFVFPQSEFEAMSELTAGLVRSEDLGLPFAVAVGGARRQDSVANGLSCLPPECSRVLVHDAARPFVSPGLTVRLLDALDAGMDAAIPGLAVTDTVKRVEKGLVTETPRREGLFAVQTPQAFVRSLLEEAHVFAKRNAIEATDDAMLAERLGARVGLVPGDPDNVKITTPDHLELLRKEDSVMTSVTGFGYDVHAYGQGRPMKLGGVPIPGAPEVKAHSDGDVLLHAVADALLACLGRGDIGELFPDTDPANEGLESSIFVAEIMELARREKASPVHLAVTIVCQTPRIAVHKNEIKRSLAALTGLPERAVNVAATTEEGLGFTGEKKGIKAMAVATMRLPG